MFKWVLLFLIVASDTFAADVGLEWDASPSAEVNAYKIYWGTASRTYTSSVQVGNVLTYKLTGLNVRTTYWFAATAIVLPENLESDFSNEVSYYVPVPKPLPPTLLRVNIVNGQAMLNFNTSPGSTYAVESSGDLTTWGAEKTVVAETTTTILNMGDVKTSPVKFYRVSRMEETPTISFAEQGQGRFAARSIELPPMPPSPVQPPKVKLSLGKKLKLFFRYRPGMKADERKGAERLMQK